MCVGGGVNTLEDAEKKGRGKLKSLNRLFMCLRACVREHATANVKKRVTAREVNTNIAPTWK